MMTLPGKFARSIIELHGQAGAEWLSRLPQLIIECEKRWSIRVTAPFAPLSVNYVAQAETQEGTPVVLKVSYPDREAKLEIHALHHFDGCGMVRLLEADSELAALLLERLQPGESISTLPDDEQATSIAVSVMRQIWKPLPEDHPFPTVADWAADLGRLRQQYASGTGPLPVRLVDQAENLFKDLLASSGAPVLLHGDLHHYNICSAQRRPWLAIDPKGVAGEPAYETGALVRNPMPQILWHPQLERLLDRRLHQLSEALEMDIQRIHGWALAQAVLSAMWSLEDQGTNWEPAIGVAQILSEIKE